MSYQYEIKFCYRGSKIRDFIRNLQQNHSLFCDTIIMCTINLFLFNSLVPRVSGLSDRDGRRFASYQKANMPWERVCVFSYSVKIELRSLRQVLHVTKQKKNRRIKKAKKLRKS